MSLVLDFSRSSIERIYKSLCYKPYIPRLAYELNEYNLDQRAEYYETFLSLLQNEPDFIHRVIWSDHINRHNSVYWTTENLHVTYGSKQHKLKILLYESAFGLKV